MHSARLLIILAISASIALAAPCLAQGQAYDQGQTPPQGQGQYAQPSGGYPANGSNPNGGYRQGPPGQGFPPWQGYPPGAQGYPPAAQGYPPMTAPIDPLAAGQKPAAASAKTGMTVAQWFNAYDQIRHQAQMSPAERQHADGLLSRGFSVLMPGDEKMATKNLLISMVNRYEKACLQLKNLPQLNQTSNLHHAYYNYFATAGQLFADYVAVQDNLFTTDAATGQPLASSLIQRKQMLEAFEHQCKQMDTQARGQYGIAAYPW